MTNCQVTTTENKSLEQNNKKQDVKATARRQTVFPRYKLNTDDHGYELKVLVPGVSKESLQLEVEGGRLSLKGIAQEPGWEQFRRVHAEFETTDYQAVFTIPKEIDTESVEAKLVQGILTVRLPKRESEKARKIQVVSG